MRIKMIVCDLDGTLLDDNHCLAEETEAAIARFVDKGGLFTIATGRNWYAAKSIVKRLNINIPVICSNGSVLANEDEVLYQSVFSAAELSAFLDEAGRSGLTVLLFEHEGVHAYGHAAGMARFRQKEKVTCRRASSFAEIASVSAQKIVLLGSIEKSLALWKQYGMDGSRDYTFMQSESDFFEIVKKGENKGAALRRLARLQEVLSRDILAIGNHMNDLEMLVEAGVGVAVSNAYAELKMYADYVCTHSYGDGVIEAIEKYCC